jgi:hypothetical protein
VFVFYKLEVVFLRYFALILYALRPLGEEGCFKLFDALKPEHFCILFISPHCWTEVCF